MQSSQELLAKYQVGQKTTKHRSQRAELIEQFMLAINQEREGTKFKPMSYKAVLLKLKPLPDIEIYPFYKQCLDGRARYGSFSKVFFGALKVKK